MSLGCVRSALGAAGGKPLPAHGAAPLQGFTTLGKWPCHSPGHCPVPQATPNGNLGRNQQQVRLWAPGRGQGRAPPQGTAPVLFICYSFMSQQHLPYSGLLWAFSVLLLCSTQRKRWKCWKSSETGSSTARDVLCSLMSERTQCQPWLVRNPQQFLLSFHTLPQSQIFQDRYRHHFN